MIGVMRQWGHFLHSDYLDHLLTIANSTWISIGFVYYLLYFFCPAIVLTQNAINCFQEPCFKSIRWSFVKVHSLNSKPVSIQFS